MCVFFGHFFSLHSIRFISLRTHQTTRCGLIFIIFISFWKRLMRCQQERESEILNRNSVWFRITLHLLLICVSLFSVVAGIRIRSAVFRVNVHWTSSLFVFQTLWVSWICWTEAILWLVFDQQFYDIEHFTSFYSSRLYDIFFSIYECMKTVEMFRDENDNRRWMLIFVMKQPIMGSAWVISSNITCTSAHFS